MKYGDKGNLVFFYMVGCECKSIFKVPWVSLAEY